ncbi:MAG: dienelactone hydrolase [Devosia sp.]|nr:dienelactone hydrolase [Devosia sp.]
MKWVLAAVFLMTAQGITLAQGNRIDSQLPDAPELAAPGALAVGVRTIELTHGDRPDVLSGTGARYDRPLRLEVWYPAALAGPSGGETYSDVHLANSDQTVSLHGQAVRDAAPLKSEQPYPLVILSHGFPGNRFLISHFGENLASKGYVVASIDHFESTYENQLGFASTLANRAPDQLFVLDSLETLSAAPSEFLAGIVDVGRSAIIGYSMGGYGALLSAGAGLSETALNLGMAPPEALSGLLAGSEAFSELDDPRLKAVVAIAPWGAQLGLWTPQALGDLERPLLLMGGTLDEISGYEAGIRSVFEGAINAERYLLSFQGAGHNAAAPIPPPIEALSLGGPGSAYEHYADFVWSNTRMNNIAQHFVTAFLDLHLKGEAAMKPYLELDTGGWQEAAGDRDWPGFSPRTTRGLVFEHRKP